MSLVNLVGKFFFGVIFSPFSKSFTNQACLINASRYRPRSLSYNKAQAIINVPGRIDTTLSQ